MFNFILDRIDEIREQYPISCHTLLAWAGCFTIQLIYIDICQRVAYPREHCKSFWSRVFFFRVHHFINNNWFFPGGVKGLRLWVDAYYEMCNEFIVWPTRQIFLIWNFLIQFDELDPILIKFERQIKELEKRYNAWCNRWEKHMSIEQKFFYVKVKGFLSIGMYFCLSCLFEDYQLVWLLLLLVLLSVIYVVFLER